jgi:hypothetical protein
MINRDSIIERLLEQSHIVIACADRILNKRGEYLQDIEDLLRDGQISTSEALTLIKDNNLFENPYRTEPIPAPSYPYPWFPDTTGTSPQIWCQTTTSE